MGTTQRSRESSSLERVAVMLTKAAATRRPTTIFRGLRLVIIARAEVSQVAAFSQVRNRNAVFREILLIYRGLPCELTVMPRPRLPGWHLSPRRCLCCGVPG